MAVKASHLCTVLVESLLEKELHRDSNVEWPNFNNRNFFTQLFTKGENRKKIKNCVAIEIYINFTFFSNTFRPKVVDWASWVEGGGQKYDLVEMEF